MPWRKDFGVDDGLNAMVDIIVVNFAVDFLVNAFVLVGFNDLMCNS